MAGAEDDPIEHEIGGAGGLVEVDVAATAVIGGEMEDNVHTLDDAFGNAGLAQIGFDESDTFFGDVFFDVVELAGAEVVDDFDAGALGDQGVDDAGANEGGTSGHQNVTIFPVHSREVPSWLRWPLIQK